MSICDNCVNEQCIFQSEITRRKCDFYIPSAQPKKRYTKADYIMALHKEYGCDLDTAEKAHNMALEYLRRVGKNNDI